MKSDSARFVVVKVTTIAAVLALLFLGPAQASTSESGNPQDQAILPNAAVQSALNELLSGNSQQMFSGSVESIRARLDQLRKTAGSDKDLVLQLLYFSMHARNEREAMLPWTVVQQLAIPNATFGEIGLSLLESKDESMRRLGSDCLTRADHNPKGGVDFSRYEVILRDKKQNPPQGLIRYMYHRDAQAAICSMVRVYSDKATAIELTDKLKGAPKTVLQSFADRPEWWARLYVAETMNKQPQLRDPAILKKLEKDDNPLVKERIAEIVDGK